MAAIRMLFDHLITGAVLEHPAICGALSKMTPSSGCGIVP
jgi:hypothetical protein